jgi:hypothetical protein
MLSDRALPRAKSWLGSASHLENQIRGLAMVFDARLPRALSPNFIEQALQASTCTGSDMRWQVARHW